MKLNNPGQGAGDLRHTDVATIFRKRDDYMVIVNRSGILFTFAVADFVEYDNGENGHMIVQCNVNGQLYSLRGDYVREHFFTKIGELVGLIMHSIHSRIVKP